MRAKKVYQEYYLYFLKEKIYAVIFMYIHQLEEYEQN